MLGKIGRKCLCKNFAKSTLVPRICRMSSTQTETASTVEEIDNNNEQEELPIIAGRKLWRLDDRNSFLEVPQAWVTNFDKIEERKLGLVDLHPDIFRFPPRLDLLHRNITWQNNYKNVSFVKALTRAEIGGGTKKPWPQKRSGRARAKDIRAPRFHGDTVRIKGLCVALTIKHVQDDLVIVDSFDKLENEEGQFLHDLADKRNWGYSLLFVDVEDTAPRNLMLACSEVPTFNIMPVYGLNCYSMMKHETLVLTLDALNRIEEKLLFHLHRADDHNKQFRYIDYKKILWQEGEDEDDPDVPPFA